MSRAPASPGARKNLSRPSQTYPFPQAMDNEKPSWKPASYLHRGSGTAPLQLGPPFPLWRPSSPLGRAHQPYRFVKCNTAFSLLRISSLQMVQRGHIQDRGFPLSRYMCQKAARRARSRAASSMRYPAHLL